MTAVSCRLLLAYGVSPLSGCELTPIQAVRQRIFFER
jgi:hypothetical protein